jgi:hypothetical protein
MELFIRIVDGQPFEHPIFEDNFRQAFPDVDTNNLPPEFARFERVAIPLLGEYEVYESTDYAMVDGVCKDVHRIRLMTNAEKEAKIAALEAQVSAPNIDAIIQAAIDSSKPE